MIQEHDLVEHIQGNKEHFYISLNEGIFGLLPLKIIFLMALRHLQGIVNIFYS